MAIHRIESLVTGTVWKLECQAGDRVTKGQTILIVESMKMEIPIDAPVAGTLDEVQVAEGEIVNEGQVLAVVTGG